MRKFKINEKPKTKKVKDGYYVKIDFMYGDADGSTTRKIGPFMKHEEAALDAFLTMLDKCLKAFPNGKGGFDQFEEKVEELKIWNFAYEPDKNETLPEIPDEIKSVIERLQFEWPLEPGDWGTQADIIEYSVKYYDDGKCYNVDISET